MGEKLSKIGSHFFLSVYICFLVFDFKVVNIALIALGLFIILDWKNKKANIYDYFIKHKKAYIFIGVFLLFQLLHGLFFQELGQRRFGLLALMVLSSVILSWLSDIRLLLKVYLSGLTIIVIFGAFNLLNYYLHSDKFNMVGGSHIDELLIINRPYLGFLLALGILFSIYLIKYDAKKTKWLYIGTILFYFVYLLIIGNRIQLLSLIVLLFIYIGFYLKTKIEYKVLGFSIVVLTILSVFYFSSTLKSRFELSSLHQKELLTSLAQREPRVIIWSCAKNIVNEADFNVYTGIGKEKLLDEKRAECYDISTKNNRLRGYFMKGIFGSHNQFIEYYVLTGIFGLLTFTGIFIYLGAILRRYFLPMAMLILLFNFCMVENLLSVQLGAYLFGFVISISLFIFSDIKKRDLTL